MNEQSWTLLGVVIGAVLGGGAQILAGVLQESRRHEQWLRDQRVQVYREFMAEWRAKYLALWDYVFDFRYDGREPPEDYLVPVHDRLAELEVFGSLEAVAAGKAALERLSEFWQANKETRKSKERAADAAFDAYRQQVRADLGVK